MNSMTVTRQQLCSMFDHTCLKPFADRSMLKQLCKEAEENRFAMVAVNSSPVAFCKEMLRGTGVHVGAAISFPLGQTTIETKVFETQDAIRNGADEIDYVINIGEMKNGNYAYIEDEMKRIVRVCRESGVLCKVIFENCYLTKEEIRRLAAIAGRVRPDYIKTSTGFGTGGAEPDDIRLMKKTVGNFVKVKAAGGIRSWVDCKKMIEAGADRIGTSSSLKILQEFDAEKREGVKNETWD